MKQSILFLSMLCMLAASCTSSDEAPACQQRGTVAVQVSGALAGAPATRSDGTQWAADAAIGLRVCDDVVGSWSAQYNNVKYVNGTDPLQSVTSISFVAAADKGKGIYFDDFSPHRFSAYAPYSETDDYARLPGTDGLIPVDTRQQSEALDYLFASGVTASLGAPAVQFTGDNAFRHCMARLELRIVGQDGFAVGQMDAFSAITLGGLCHDGTFSVLTGQAAISTGATAVDDWDLLSQPHTDAADAAMRTYVLYLLPQDCSATPLTLRLDYGGMLFENNTLLAPNLQAGLSYCYTVTLSKRGMNVSYKGLVDWNYSATTQGYLRTTDLTNQTAPYTVRHGEAITGTTQCQVKVPSGATVFLDGLQTTSNIVCEGDATVYLIGENVISPSDGPGIACGPTGTILTIDGDAEAQLTVRGSADNPGIGIRYDAEASNRVGGDIVINGGRIIAVGGKNGAGIGGCKDAESAGTITINGGEIEANGGMNAAAIGGGGGTLAFRTFRITINGGRITAVAGDEAAGIGGGLYQSCSNIVIDSCPYLYVLGGRSCIGGGNYNYGKSTVRVKNATLILDISRGGCDYFRGASSIIPTYVGTVVIYDASDLTTDIAETITHTTANE